MRLQALVDVDLDELAAVHVGVGLDRLDERRPCARSTRAARAARPRAVSDAATQRSAAPVAGPGELARPASSHAVVDAGGRQRLGQPPRLGDAEVLEALEHLVLGVGGVERRRARPLLGARERLALQRDEPLGVVALDAGLDERAERRADHVERLGQVGRRRAGPPRPGC